MYIYIYIEREREGERDAFAKVVNVINHNGMWNADLAGYFAMKRVQILDEADCISQNTNTLRKDMNPLILPPTMGIYPELK